MRASNVPILFRIKSITKDAAQQRAEALYVKQLVVKKYKCLSLIRLRTVQRDLYCRAKGALPARNEAADGNTR